MGCAEWKAVTTNRSVHCLRGCICSFLTLHRPAKPRPRQKALSARTINFWQAKEYFRYNTTPHPTTTNHIFVMNQFSGLYKIFDPASEVNLPHPTFLWLAQTSFVLKVYGHTFQSKHQWLGLYHKLLNCIMPFPTCYLHFSLKQFITLYFFLAKPVYQIAVQ